MGNLQEQDWEILLLNIQTKECTPFIGAGAGTGYLPDGAKLAEELVNGTDYPFEDVSLVAVSQYLAIVKQSMFPKNVIKDRIQGAPFPPYDETDEPHAAMADLELPLYVTTNYDDFMFRAIQLRRGLEPYRAFCPWNNHERVRDAHEHLPRPYKPTSDKPLVYHLHGHWETAQSMVVTEADYLSFLIEMTRGNPLHPAVRDALSSSMLLFLGYSLSDWSFRVLFRSIFESQRANLDYPSIAIQLPPNKVRADKRDQAREYLETYFRRMLKIDKVSVFWGDVREFTSELRGRL